MDDVTKWKVAKWPFLLIDLLLLAFAYFVVWKSPHPISSTAATLCIVSVALGAIVGCLPFILDYRAMGKVIEVNALGAVSEKIQNLEKFTGQISSATDQWARVQEATQGNADKTIAAAKQISEKMAAEVREFSEFMKKMDDSEKAALRLEVEKSQRGQTEWLQMIVHILDHIFALHNAAARSGQPKVAEQLAQFQNAIRGTIRRIGLAVLVPAPDEPFDSERHKLVDAKLKPPADAVVGETLTPGYTFQGKLLRPAIVRLREKISTIESTTKNLPPQEPEATAETELSLD
ncbi:MAG TPA: nucleotide exchange factor GrpE [Verrucomicrobiae bacterium]|nr:nucleotide exchange factor GrpE [Verrucomicrobiae bacterium]